MRNLFVFIAIFISISVSAQVGIGTTTPAASSMLEIVSTSKGLLIPRMTEAERIVIASPAEGLVVYQSNNTRGFYQYTSSAWLRLQAGNVPGTEVSGGTARQMLTSNGTGGASWGKKMLAGVVTFGDINSGSGSLTVTGDISSATKDGGGTRLVINFPDLGNTNYVAIITMESTRSNSDGSLSQDNDLSTPIILEKTSSSFRVMLEETGSVVQSLKINVLIVTF
jgi:hypothetical protein